MKINVEGIEQGSRTLESTYSIKDLDLDNSEWTFLKDCYIRAKVTKMGDDVFVECVFRTDIEQTCCRCLDPFRFAIKTGFKTLFVREAPPIAYRRNIRRPIRSDEEDKVVYFKGREIHLSEEIKNAIQLFLPMKLLCQTECLGLCPYCGTNQNESHCQCIQKPSRIAYHPFSSLQAK